MDVRCSTIYKNAATALPNTPPAQTHHLLGLLWSSPRGCVWHVPLVRWLGPDLFRRGGKPRERHPRMRRTPQPRSCLAIWAVSSVCFISVYLPATAFPVPCGCEGALRDNLQNPIASPFSSGAGYSLQYASGSSMMTLFTNGVLVDDLTFTLTEIRKEMSCWLPGNEGIPLSFKWIPLWLIPTTP